VHNGHSWDLKNMVVMQRVFRKISVVISFRLVVKASNWPLLMGGRYSEVVVRTGLTVHTLGIKET
jgi:hypothetical protein